VNTTAFTNPTNGTFSVRHFVDQKSLVILYTPVPELHHILLLAAIVLILGLQIRRRWIRQVANA